MGRFLDLDIFIHLLYFKICFVFSLVVFVLVLVIMSSQLPIFNFDLKDLLESCNDSAIDNFGTDLMNNIIDK